MSYITKITMNDILRRLIQVRGYTYTYLAKKSGLNDTYICKLKTSESTAGIRLSTLKALSEALDVPQSLLFNAPYPVIWEDEKEIKKWRLR